MMLIYICIIYPHMNSCICVVRHTTLRTSRSSNHLVSGCRMVRFTFLFCRHFSKLVLCVTHHTKIIEIIKPSSERMPNGTFHFFYSADISANFVSLSIDACNVFAAYLYNLTLRIVNPYSSGMAFVTASFI